MHPLCSSCPSALPPPSPNLLLNLDVTKTNNNEPFPIKISENNLLCVASFYRVNPAIDWLPVQHVLGRYVFMYMQQKRQFKVNCEFCG